MFDFAWSEMAVIAAVALVLIGPKDMPVAIRSITGMIKKARRMAGEFQTHVDEMMKEADLKEVRDTFGQIRNFDFRGTVEKAIDPDRSLRDTFSDDPFAAASTSTETLASEAAAGEHLPEPEPALPPPPERVPAPGFVPPALVPLVAKPAELAPPPAFIPPVPMLQRPSL